MQLQWRCSLLCSDATAVMPFFALFRRNSRWGRAGAETKVPSVGNLSHVLCVNPHGAAVTILGPQSFPPMSHSCAQIRGLYYKTEGSLFWEEGKAIFCTRHEESFDWILQKLAKELVQVRNKKLRAFEYSDCTFGARVRKTAGARSCRIPELKGLKLSTRRACMLTLPEDQPQSDHGVVFWPAVTLGGVLYIQSC